MITILAQLDGTASKNKVTLNVNNNEWSGNIVKDASTMATPTTLPKAMGGNYLAYATGTAALVALTLI